jgi:hypothetical protein
MAAFWAAFTFGGSGPALTAHGSLDLKQEIQIQIQIQTTGDGNNEKKKKKKVIQFNLTLLIQKKITCCVHCVIKK